jgi:hypothetical protein
LFLVGICDVSHYRELISWHEYPSGILLGGGRQDQMVMVTM